MFGRVVNSVFVPTTKPEVHEGTETLGESAHRSAHVSELISDVPQVSINSACQSAPEASLSSNNASSD